MDEREAIGVERLPLVGCAGDGGPVEAVGDRERSHPMPLFDLGGDCIVDRSHDRRTTRDSLFERAIDRTEQRGIAYVLCAAVSVVGDQANTEVARREAEQMRGIRAGGRHDEIGAVLADQPRRWSAPAETTRAPSGRGRCSRPPTRPGAGVERAFPTADESPGRRVKTGAECGRP